MNIDLSGKKALVTGGNIGIGAAISINLAQQGADVALTYHTHAEAAEQTCQEIRAAGRQAFSFPLDATQSDQVNQVVPAAVQALGGRLDILINNAGHLINRVLVEEMDDAHWHKVIDVNLASAFYCTRAALPYLKQQGGRIVNMSSLAGRNGGGYGTVPYAASKAAVIGMTRAMAKEFAPYRITVNALAPGFIVDTPFHETFTGVDNYDSIIQTIPLKRAGVPDDVAGAMLYFVSDLGAWVTGQVAEINGGVWFV
ncbi:MAG: SDR family oxidoreductase [Anaerolineae bacterium]|nr:SDR family oxidoreductase [Anaerolineae bacterium]